jgi:hypothetical protein
MPRRETYVRFWIGIIAIACVAGCGREEAAPPVQAPAGMASEITVELPPPAEPTKVKLDGPNGESASYDLGPAEPDTITLAWAGVLRDNGFPCDRIVSARPLARADGSAVGIYRIECASGGIYQGTRRANGRLYFRNWPGRI